MAQWLSREVVIARRSPADPICPACSRRILPGDLVVFGHGDLTHIDCLFETGGGDHVVGRFLAGKPDQRYCHTCLAASLEISWHHVSKSVARLRTTPRFLVSPGPCSVCGKERVTIQATGPPEDPVARG